MRYRFGECVMATATRELTRGARAIALAPQVFDLLEYLIRHRQRVIGKEELFATIWRGRAVSDSALTTRIYVARACIGDNAKEQRYVKTVARRGVRFVGQVEEIDDEGSDATTAGPPRVGMSRSCGSGRPSLCVLAFGYVDGDRRSEEFGRMLSAEARLEFTRLRWLSVVPVSDDTFHRPAATGAAGSRLIGSEYLLRGTVKQVDRLCRVTTELVEVSSGLTIWGERFDTDRPESLGTQRSIAEVIVRAASAALVASERSRALTQRSVDLDAWQSYQVGMWHMSRFNHESSETARRYFRQTIQIDASFALGFSALAWAQMMGASIYSSMTVAEGCELAMPLIARAMALDEYDTEARARLALADFLEGDVRSAIEEADAVLTVKADCASALGVKGAALLSIGRRQEGRAAISEFLRLSPNDPVRPVRLTQTAASYYLDGDYGEAARIAKRVTRQFPQHPFAYRWLAASLGQLERRDEADAALRTLRKNWPNSFNMYVAKQPPSYCSAEYKPLLSGLRKAGWKD
jgi:DNA-binding winged helix-turn-helix (wHTH) protein/tetratricopeptide (TPR) repeat protein